VNIVDEAIEIVREYEEREAVLAEFLARLKAEAEPFLRYIARTDRATPTSPWDAIL
jgi:hypothetical protein